MLTIRLQRGGAKKRPFYHLVVTDSRKARDSGNHRERVGFYNPVARGNEQRLKIDEERIQHWIEVGAKPSNRVLALLKENARAQKRSAA